MITSINKETKLFTWKLDNRKGASRYEMHKKTISDVTGLEGLSEEQVNKLLITLEKELF